ncbi:mucin-5AC [Scaptodrosophila lebanonensis]|uniref:Mucin-5AC n=1 Tax=Drosophila lebanonensis TaxID=7225 RepID=A0A6J2TKU7_DROLE|nr:mucin-5AC [Scaptodrosophila lebanonensis]
MDTVYGTKKYFQSLSGVSDIYRTQTCRAMATDYTYQNTLGRRSQLGAYYHMNKQPSYTNDHSIASQYGYNTWGIWRDGRNIAPSTFSTKTHTHYPKNRSFSIILTTAAFIVLLAVISIAGLAFYFSSIKATLEEPILGFEGSFRIAKGDLYSTGLKYNHTTTYKQKIEFYKRFVERALADNGLQALRTDVWGFGDGPLIKISFRVFLDVRKLPQNILSVEEYIKESLFLETSGTKSLYRSLRLDAESVEIKRIMDEQVVRSAAILKEAQTVPTSQTQLEKRLMKKGGGAPLQTKPVAVSTPKPRTTARPHSTDDEPDIDVENAPVIQGSFEGSFEITKTDADIARKKTSPTRAYQSSSLPPKAVTPYALRVKPKKPSLEKLTTVTPQGQPQPQPILLSSTTSAPTTTKPTTTTRQTTTTTVTTTTTTTTTSKPTSQKPTSEANTWTSSTTTTTTARPVITTKLPNSFTFPSLSPPTSTVVVPKLDANLFTTFPILDTQPWRPIHREVPELLPGPPPAYPTKTLPVAGKGQHPASASTPATLNHIPQRRIDEFELPFIAENPTPPSAAMLPSAHDPYMQMPSFHGPAMAKPDFSNDNENEPNQQDMLFYHNFGSPILLPGTENIERLGGAFVEPHPLPVPLIDDVLIPPFKPINPTLGTMDKIPFNIDAGSEKFEHLGGGVIAKKQENGTKSETKSDTVLLQSTTPKIISTTVTGSTTPLQVQVMAEQTSSVPLPDSKPTGNSVLADTIGEFFMELLNLPKEENLTTTTTTTQEPLESRIEPEESESVESLNITEKVTTIKPTFLNLKELILQRNQPNTNIQSNATLTSQTTTKTTTMATTRSTTSTTTTAKPTIITTTKRNRIRPSSDRPPTMLDDSNLFPSHSKWEFVNSSSTQNFGHNGNMRKVFNQTLQAWVSEDIDKSENFTLDDIKTRINNATNIQDISLIFDTLASKLGITPSLPTKFPPFSQNKLKHSQKNDTKMRPFITTTELPIEKTSVRNFIELPLQQREPFIKPMSSFMEDNSPEVLGAAIPVVGEAEVEVVDPLNYEEMLKISQFAESTSTEPTLQHLVTLLPVRSNSGIRTYKPPVEEIESQRSQSGSAPSLVKANTTIRRKINVNHSRKFGPPPEAVVKGGLKVTVN